MNVGVIGSRTFKDYKLLSDTLDKYKISILVSGGAKGADSLGEKYADEHNIEKLIFKPDWNLGRGAGFIRNVNIIDESDLIIAFWDGQSKGTAHSIELAKKKNKKIIIIKC